MALPVLGAGVRVHDQRVALRSLEKGVYLLCKRVGDGHEGEGIALRRPGVLFVLARVAPHLGEAVVHEQTSAAGMALDGVEHAAAIRTGVPAFVNELADDATAKRRTVGVRLVEGSRQGVPRAGNVFRRVVQEGDEITYADKAEVHDARALGVVYQFVDPTALETAFDIEIDV